MIKLLHVLAIASLIGSAGYAYSIKYDTVFRAEQLARLKGEVRREREAIAVLKAEWAYLNRPDRVQELTDRFLPEIVPLDPRRLVRFSDLPERPEAQDEIGRKLEALGLAAPTATPRATGSISGRTPSQTPSR